MNNVKRVLVGIFALAVAGTAFAATPVHTPTPHKDQVFFQGKWRHVHKWHEVSLPLLPNQTVRQVEKLAKEISAIRYGQPPFLYQMHGKHYLIWRN